MQPVSARPNWPPIPTPGPHVLMDRHAVSGCSQELNAPIPAGLSTIVVEVFPAGTPGTCSVQMLDAGPFGPLQPCADPAGLLSGVTGYKKAVVRNVMDRVACDLTVTSGSWSVWVTFIPYGSTLG